MAIVMTKKGEHPHERTMIGTCMGCMSEYEAKFGDLTHRDYQRETCHIANCQLCSRVVYFKEKAK